MPKLSASYSGALHALIEGDAVSIDAVEFGPWFSPKQITAIRKKLPELEFYFHGSNLFSDLRFRRLRVMRFRRYLECTQSKWLSIHIELLPRLIFTLSNKFNLHLPPPDPERAQDWFISAVETIKQHFEVPIILENLASLPAKKYHYAAKPANIKAIVATTQSGFLLDIAHARLAADYQGRDVLDFISSLPLNHIKQIHVSGIRRRDEYFWDAHEEMGEEDYAILKWVLQRAKPDVITLEYFRNRQPLRDQLGQLREILAQCE